MLNILENYDLRKNDAESKHLMAEAMRRAYADRSLYPGDTDFVAVPLRGLLAKDYAAQLRAQIDPQRATPSNS
jgi:gamma-glutamyltranspeptidase/glutathione hydrolase